MNQVAHFQVWYRSRWSKKVSLGFGPLHWSQRGGDGGRGTTSETQPGSPDHINSFAKGNSSGKLRLAFVISSYMVCKCLLSEPRESPSLAVGFAALNFGAPINMCDHKIEACTSLWQRPILLLANQGPQLGDVLHVLNLSPQLTAMSFKGASCDGGSLWSLLGSSQSLVIRTQVSGCAPQKTAFYYKKNVRGYFHLWININIRKCNHIYIYINK